MDLVVVSRNQLQIFWTFLPLLSGKVSLDNDLKAFYANSTDSNPMILFNC
ncbi:hypothetical protein GXM_05210 [Nostoc sphaeroides CCNUC1]|uniref:Uncharacterized protein n=1 Tax=Nostoc sphaeroides CCNUC1 TaxID=2653204 RepID=A0A5P8W4P9_9NOSO|nr:hypothetical protein GXM_05210 [Nostoc sphaeroides CCNUC1]